MNEMTKFENNFVGYDYKEVTVKHDTESLYTDNYPYFGWTLDGSSNGIKAGLKGLNSVTLKFKRDRKINHKAELTRLQRQFEAKVEELKDLEKSKSTGATITAYTVGILGTAAMAGSVFSMEADMLPLSIALAVPGFIGWILPYFCYTGIRKRKAKKVLPLLENQYESIYQLCENANTLLAK